MIKQTPPFGKKFQRVPMSGVRVAVGPGAWGFARTHCCPIMVLPIGDHPRDYRWPSDGKPALIHELGEHNDEQLDAMAQALLTAGAPSVVAIREALLNDFDPRVFYEAEVIDATA